MKVGRERAVRGRGAGQGHARAPRARLSADGRRQHALDASTRRSAPPARCSRSDSSGSRSRPSPTTCTGHVRIVREGGLPIAAGENLHTLYEFQAMIAAGGVTFPEPDVTNCGGVTVFMKVAHLAEAFNLPVTSHGAHDLTRPPAGRRSRTAPTSKPTASASSASSPSRCGSKTATRSRANGRATASSSTGRDSRRCAPTDPGTGWSVASNRARPGGAARCACSGQSLTQINSKPPAAALGCPRPRA